MLKFINIILILFAWNSIFGQPLNTVLFEDINIKDKIIHLKIAPEYQKAVFIIGFVKNDKVVANTDFLFASNQYFDIRDLENTPSRIDFITTNLPQEAFLRKSLNKPNLSQEIAILFSKSPFGPRLVNLISHKFFFGYRYTLVILTGILILFPILLFALKQPSLKAGLISLFVGFILIDLPNINDQITTYRIIENQYPFIDVIASTQLFVEEIKPIIQGKSWRFQGEFKDEYQKLFLKYSFVDIEFAQENMDEKFPKGTYFISQNGSKPDQELVYENYGFRLFIQQ